VQTDSNCGSKGAFSSATRQIFMRWATGTLNDKLAPMAPSHEELLDVKQVDGMSCRERLNGFRQISTSQ
jgi:hypothetical protein